MKKIMSLILALTLILSFGSFMASAETTEVVNPTTVAPVNYANQEIYPQVSVMRSGSSGADSNLIVRPTDEAAVRAGSITSTSSVYSNSMSSSTNAAANAWFAIDLGVERDISKVELVQHYNKIRDYKLYYTNDATVIAEIKEIPQKSALTQDGKVALKVKEKTDGWQDVVVKDWYDSTTDTPTEGDYGVNMTYHGQGIIDKLTLLTSGTLTDKSHLSTTGTYGDGQINGATNVAVDEIMFPKTSARCIVLVIENDYANRGTSMMLWSFKAFGTEEKSSTAFDQFPESYVNYANKTLYPGVTAIRSDIGNEAANGVPDTLVNPNSTATTTSFGVATVIPSLKKAGLSEYYDNSWFAIDLGAERSFDKIDIYQYKNRMEDVEVYSATAEQFADVEDSVENDEDKELDANIINGLTLLGTGNVSATDLGKDAVVNNSKTELTKPGTISFGSAVKARYIVFVIKTNLVPANGMPVFEVHVIGRETSIQQTNAYPTNGLDYTVKFVNDGNEAKRYAIVEAQYNVNDEMIANNIKYVDIDPLYAKSFTGEITKVDGAAKIKVFSWCLSDLTPMETEYTFNIQ